MLPAKAASRATVEKVGVHWARHRGAPLNAHRRVVPGDALLGLTKGELLRLARRFGVRGRGRMTKAELANAVARAP